MLKRKLDSLPESTQEDFRIRAHRAISWLARADSAANDHDVRFLLLWIAFNAAYAQEFGFEQREREQVREFFARLLLSDREQRLQRLLFGRYSGPIRTLIENRYVFEPFWRALREHDASGRWEASFRAARETALVAVTGGDALTVLGIVMDRLYVLRNQLVHGGATHGSHVNRQQVGDGVALLADLVPLVIELMLDDCAHDFGAIAYPVVVAG